jgi:hypothetical protein
MLSGDIVITSGHGNAACATGKKSTEAQSPVTTSECWQLLVRLLQTHISPLLSQGDAISAHILLTPDACLTRQNIGELRRIFSGGLNISIASAERRKATWVGSVRIATSTTDTQPSLTLIISAQEVMAEQTTSPTSKYSAPTATNARVTRSNPPNSPKRASRPRKMTDEQYAAHQEEQAWCSALLVVYRTALDVKTLPNEGKERNAAH